MRYRPALITEKRQTEQLMWRSADKASKRRLSTVGTWHMAVWLQSVIAVDPALLRRGIGLDRRIPSLRSALGPSRAWRICQQACNVLLCLGISGLDKGDALVSDPVDGGCLDRSPGPERSSDALFGSVPVAGQRHCTEASTLFGDGSVEDSGGGEVCGAAVWIGGALNDRGPFAGIGLDTSGGVAGGALGVADLTGEAFLP
jgi:hypothetical protein